MHMLRGYFGYKDDSSGYGVRSTTLRVHCVSSIKSHKTHDAVTQLLGLLGYGHLQLYTENELAALTVLRASCCLLVITLKVHHCDMAGASR